MKLSDFTLSVLKNFATINDGIVLFPGSHIRTVSDPEGIFAEAEVDDVFTSEFGVFDLNNFLGNVSTLNQPELTFNGKQVKLDDGVFQVNYTGYDKSLIAHPPEGKTIRIVDPDVTFDLPKDILSKLLKLAAMNSLSSLTVQGVDGKLSIKMHEKTNPDSHSAATPIGNFEGANFTANFKVENMKMLPDDYLVELKSGVMAKFTSKTRKLSYVIGMQTK